MTMTNRGQPEGHRPPTTLLTPEMQAERHSAEERLQSRVDAWWAWHDADPSRWSPGEDPSEATADAEARCAAWMRGESDDGPES
jgi:hypothetical protein